MGVAYNPKVVTSGLKFHIDAANIKSYDSSDQGISGEQSFTTAGTTNWTVTTGVTEVSAVVVGGGGGGAGGDSGGYNDEEGGCGGGGGGLAYGTFPVTPGETLTIVVGSGGGGGSAPAGNGTNGNPSQIKRGSTVLLQGGGGSRGTHGIPGSGGAGGSSSGTQRDGGGNGGPGGEAQDNTRGDAGGGGGAGGYSGNGGAGGERSAGGSGSGGAGGGGGSDTYPKAGGAGGGGVGLDSKSKSGGSGPQWGGKAGSGGSDGDFGSSYTGVAGDGGNYGGGGGGGAGWNSSEEPGGDGSPGAVKIVWGFGRKYPEEAAPASASTKIKNITNDSTRTEAFFGKATHISNGVSSAFDIDGEHGIIKDDSIFTDSVLQGNWTMSFWVKFDTLPTSIGHIRTLFSHGTNATRQGLLLSAYRASGSGNALYFSLTGDNKAGSAILSTNTWYNAVFTLNNTTYEKQIYLNGSLDTSHTGGGAYSGSGSNARLFKFLLHDTSSYDSFDGSLGNFSFYNRVLTASEIQQNFNALRGRYGI